MTLLVLSPDFASHYGPLAGLAAAASRSGERVVVATGETMRPRVQEAGFEWMHLRLGAASNGGSASDSPALRAFLGATRVGAVATLHKQMLDREADLLWRPVDVGRRIADIIAGTNPDLVLVDHVSFGSTLGVYATGFPFVSLVPGHPSQLPVGTERYGLPERWPDAFEPEPAQLAELRRLADRTTAAFTERFNSALRVLSPARQPVADAFRVHGRRVLYNAVEAHQAAERRPYLPADHRFVGPLVRRESLPAEFAAWSGAGDPRPRVYVALGTFLSHRVDVLRKIADALRTLDLPAAIATGPNLPAAIGPVPDDWVIAPNLPQVALLESASVAIHHGGNNSIQESLAAGCSSVVMPFSTDQFANAFDLERAGVGTSLDPNACGPDDIARAVLTALLRPTHRMTPLSSVQLARSLFEPPQAGTGQSAA